MNYLVVLLDEGNASDIWLYVALSHKRFEAVHQGSIDLYHAFKEAEDEIVYEVTIFQSSHPSQIKILPTNALSDSQLPVAGEFLILS